MLLLNEKIQESLQFVIPKLTLHPKIAVVLGSGLGYFSESILQATILPTSEIPHYPRSTVPGHSGRWVIGRITKVPIIAVQGRVHLYEGYSIQDVVYPIHLLASLGINVIILTTACGGLNPGFKPGDLMLITDQINLAFRNPLIGKPKNQVGPRFPDMSQAFDPTLLEIARKTGAELGLPFREGVFCWVTGPNYETAAEVQMLRKLGGDAVSMSTAPEVIAARQRYMRVLGISLITNLGTGLSETKLTHREVTETARRSGERLGTLLREIIGRIYQALELDVSRWTDSSSDVK